MMSIFSELVLFLVPVLLAGLVHHLIIIPQNRFKFLAIPVDGGKKWQGKPLLGKRKTWRGIVVMVVVTGVVFGLENMLFELDFLVHAWIAGMTVGLGYALAELPNSLIKRRVGIGAGEKTKGIFSFVDHVDSVLGAVMGLSLVYPVKFWLGLGLVVWGGLTHWSVDKYLKMRGYKKCRRLNQKKE